MTGLATNLYNAGKAFAANAMRRSNLRDTYTFTDRKQGAATALIVLAGYKQALWPTVFPRLEKAVPDGVDVCVMSAGKNDADLASICQRNGWSYLATRTNDVSLVQNIAINLHDKAQTIIKMDEDIFVTPGTIRDTLAYFEEVCASGIVDPGFVSPMLNVNGVCYRPLLKQLGLLEAFETRFGVARISTLGVPATDSADAARWIWEHTAPLEATVTRLRRTASPELMAPVQFSIGLIVMKRAFWEDFGYYPVKRHMLAMKKSTLGADEERICKMATFMSRPVVVCEHALAGHFSFGRQYEGMLKLLHEKPELFRPAG